MKPYTTAKTNNAKKLAKTLPYCFHLKISAFSIVNKEKVFNFAEYQHIVNIYSNIAINQIVTLFIRY